MVALHRDFVDTVRLSKPALTAPGPGEIPFRHAPSSSSIRLPGHIARTPEPRRPDGSSLATVHPTITPVAAVPSKFTH